MYYHITGHLRRAVGNIDVGGMLAAARSQNFQRIRQEAPRSLILSYTMAANGAPGAKLDVYECLVSPGI